MNKKITKIEINNTTQTVICGDSRNMDAINDDSVHLIVTSPPYLNAKKYSDTAGDIGNLADLDLWIEEISGVWKESYRILQPGRKFFLNVMNLPVPLKKSFRTLNVIGKSIDICEEIGFIFKRDIVWHKTNGALAHFGTYPYPGGILLNTMHEYILEFEKYAKPNIRKYTHLTQEQKEQSKLDKDFWVSIKKSDVWLMNPEKSGRASRDDHPAPFPLELPTRLIKAFSFKTETIVDPFVGAGTTLQAAANLGRNGIGYELNSKYCNNAIASLGN